MRARAPPKIIHEQCRVFSSTKRLSWVCLTVCLASNLVVKLSQITFVIYDFHADVKPFQICCNLGCLRSVKPFTSFYTFCDHVYAYHSGITADLSTPSETEQESPQQQDNDTDEDAMSPSLMPQSIRILWLPFKKLPPLSC